MLQVQVSPECIAVGANLATECALILVSFSMNNLHMLASDLEIPERLVTQETLTTAITSLDKRTYTHANQKNHFGKKYQLH